MLAGAGMMFLAGPDVAIAQDRIAANTANRVAEVTYSKDVAPIMQRVCQDCHRPGTSAPFSLLSYEDARRFAPLIKLRTQARDMPPWPIDQTVGIQKFKNDISLSDQEIATIAEWVDGGAQEGNPADLPPARVFPPEGSWNYELRFGRPPDLVLRSPSSTVRATGMDQWPTP
jgi:mono/diheme cytochrome c family protein